MQRIHSCQAQSSSLQRPNFNLVQFLGARGVFVFGLQLGSARLFEIRSVLGWGPIHGVSAPFLGGSVWPLDTPCAVGDTQILSRRVRMEPG